MTFVCFYIFATMVFGSMAASVIRKTSRQRVEHKLNAITDDMADVYIFDAELPYTVEMGGCRQGTDYGGVCLCGPQSSREACWNLRGQAAAVQFAKENNNCIPVHLGKAAPQCASGCRSRAGIANVDSYAGDGNPGGGLWDCLIPRNPEPSPEPAAPTPSAGPTPAVTTLRQAAEETARVKVGTIIPVPISPALRRSLYWKGRTLQAILDDQAPRWDTFFNDTEQTIARTEFNSLSSGNMCKMHWMVKQTRNGWHFDFSACDEHRNFAKEAGMAFRFHVLIYGKPPWGGPEWIKDLPTASKRRLLVEYIDKVVKHYGEDVDTWDVVNEAYEYDGLRDSYWLNTTSSYPNVWYSKSGSHPSLDNYVDLAFQAARNASASAKLVYNDFAFESIDPNPSGNHDNPIQRLQKSDRIFNKVKSLKANGLIDGIGMQMHVHIDNHKESWYQGLLDNMRGYANIGVDIHITEIDIHGITQVSQLQAQADMYARILDICLSVSACKSFTTWGLSDRYTWLNSNFTLVQRPLLFDEYCHKKPAYESVFRSLTGFSPLPTTPAPSPAPSYFVEEGACREGDGYGGVCACGSRLSRDECWALRGQAAAVQFAQENLNCIPVYLSKSAPTTCADGCNSIAGISDVFSYSGNGIPGGGQWQCLLANNE